MRKRSLSPTRGVLLDELPDSWKHSMFEYPLEDRPPPSFFDSEGHLSLRQAGVNTFRFKRLNFFYMLRSLSWKTLISLSIAFYLFVLSIFAVLYFSMCWACQSEVSAVSAWYFTVVSLAANGGYMGEDMENMVPGTYCYLGRTIIVMTCSYVNILFVGLVAALVVGKAEFGGRLGQRIVFSDLCTLTSHGGDRWRIAFRVANSLGNNPLIHGRLRLFAVRAIPLKEYEARRREKRRERRRKRALARLSHKSGSPTSTHDRGRKRDKGSHGTMSPTSGFPSLTKDGRRLGSRQFGTEYHSFESVSRAMSDYRTKSKESTETSAPRQPTADFSNAPLSKEGLARLAEKTSSAAPAASGLPSYGACDTEKVGVPPVINTRVSDSTSDRFSAKTNSSVNTIAMDGGSDDDEEGSFERVKIILSELDWTCPEETATDASSGELSLWFPVTIFHEINEKSPLYEFMENPIAFSADDMNIRSLKARKQLRERQFQLAVVFDATELESGSTIVAKRTYTTTDIIAHYRFSEKLIHVRTGSSEVRLDYHYFNELVPVMADESSTDSDDNF